jgi:hypothetical protein
MIPLLLDHLLHRFNLLVHLVLGKCKTGYKEDEKKKQRKAGDDF